MQAPNLSPVLLMVLAVLLGSQMPAVHGNDFPSLLVANATVAIILDHEYLGDAYESTVDAVKVIVEKVLRENMKDGGLKIKYFSWTQINFNKDFTAVISITNCKNTWRTYHSAFQENLLYIALTEADCPRLPANDAIMIPTIKVGQELPQILLDIRASHAINWKTAILIYDETFDRDTVSRVVTALSSESQRNQAAMTVSMFRLAANNSNGEAVRTTLKLLATSNYIGRNYIIITTNPLEMLRIAGELNMVDTGSQWLFLLTTVNTSDSSSSLTVDDNHPEGLAASIREGGNVAFVMNTTKSEQCERKLFCNFEETLLIFAQSVEKVISMEAAIYGQISDEEWEAIRMSKKERRNVMLEFIRKRLIESATCGTCLQWELLAVETWGLRYNMSSKETGVLAANTPTPVPITAAVWEPTNGLIMRDALFPHISHGFRMKVLPIVAYHNPPWQIFTYTESGEIVSKKGVVMHILDELASKLNFTYKIIEPVKVKNLTILSNEEYAVNASIESTLNVPAEVLDLLTNDKVFLGACGVTVSEYLRRSVNFTRPFSIQSHTLLISRPKELGRLYLFMAPFSHDTWFCLIGTIIVIGPLLFAVNYLTPYNDHLNILKVGGLYKISNCCWYIYGALLQQGGMYLPRSDSARIIVGTWWLVVLVVVTTYCGNLVAFLTFPKIDTPISTVGQLLNSEGVTWGLRSDTYLQQYLKYSEDDKYRRLREGAIVYAEQSAEMIEQVRRGKHVHIDWKSNLQFIMKEEFLKTDSCDFSLGSVEFLDEQIAMVLSPVSPYLTIVNQEIYRLQQMGFVQKWLAEYLPTKDRCWSGGKMVEIENHTVNLNDMQGCFLVLLAGVIAAIFIILVECFVTQHSKRKANTLVKPFAQ